MMSWSLDPDWKDHDMNITSNITSNIRPLARTAGQEVRLNGWNIPPDELEHVPDHWLSYPEPPASIHFMLGILYTFLMVASLIGNGLVIWVFTCAKSLRTASNMFVVNLAILDFIMLAKAPIFLFNSFARGFALGHKGCQIFAVIGSISGIGAGMTNAFIAYDRYNVITRPMDGHLSMPKAILMVSFVWLYCIPWTVMPLTEVWGRFVPGAHNVTIIAIFSMCYCAIASCEIIKNKFIITEQLIS